MGITRLYTDLVYIAASLILGYLGYQVTVEVAFGLQAALSCKMLYHQDCCSYSRYAIHKISK